MTIRPLLLSCAVVAMVTAAVSPAPAPGAQTLTIPVITSLTGSGAFMGKQAENTLQRVETLVNREGGIRGVPIHFELYDDQAKPQVDVQLMSDITGKGYPVVIGPSTTNACLAVAPFVGDKIVDYCLSPGVDPAKGSYVFSVGVGGPDIFATMVRYFRKKGWNRIATLTTADATGQQADQRFGGAVALPENTGVQIVAQEHFAPADLSVTAQVARIKSAQPNVVVVWVIGTPFVTALHGLSDGGYTGPVFASNSNMIVDELDGLASIMPSQLLFVGPQFLGAPPQGAQRKPVEAFYSVTKDEGVKPDYALALSWDAAQITVAALRRYGATASAGQIHAYIEGLHGFPGIFGNYDFTDGHQRGLTQRDLTILRWEPKRSDWVAVSKPGGEPL